MNKDDEAIAYSTNEQTEVLKPITLDASINPKTYSYKNTQSKRKLKKKRKENKEKFDDQEIKLDYVKPLNSINDFHDLSAIPTIENNQTESENLPVDELPQITDEENNTVSSQPNAAQTKAKDPNKTYFIGAVCLVGLAFILFAAIAVFGFPYFYNQGVNAGNAGVDATNSAKTSGIASYKDSTENKSDSKNAADDSKDSAGAVCAHEWEEVKTTIHHDAVTHDVNHDAEYQTVTRYHTVCNVCSEQIDNKIIEHKEQTGHYSWSTNVPFQEQELVNDAYVQTVTDQEAYDEQMVLGRKCKKCGQSELYE